MYVYICMFSHINLGKIFVIFILMYMFYFRTINIYKFIFFGSYLCMNKAHVTYMYCHLFHYIKSIIFPPNNSKLFECYTIQNYLNVIHSITRYCLHNYFSNRVSKRLTASFTVGDLLLYAIFENEKCHVNVE